MRSTSKSYAWLATVFSLVFLPAAQAVTVFDVDSRLGWQDTGVSVQAGGRLQITSTGLVLYNSPPEYAGPDGGTLFFDPNSYVPEADNLSLVGRIVPDGRPPATLLPEGLPGRGPGFVGSSYDKIVPSSGRLQLVFNDSFFADNEGSFRSTIVFTPVPEPGALFLALLGASAAATVVRYGRSGGGMR